MGDINKIKLILSGGRTIESPSPEVIAQELLGCKGGRCTLVSPDGSTLMFDTFLMGPTLEYQDRGGRGPYYCAGLSMQTVIDAFQQCAAGRTEWKQSLAWKRRGSTGCMYAGFKNAVILLGVLALVVAVLRFRAR